jgi:DNA recombination protein RmuC
MPIEAMLVIVTLLAILVATLCVAMLYRMRSGSSMISPVLDQRLVAIEGSITRSDTLVRGEFAQGRDESREGARSLREEITTQFGSLATSVRGSLADFATGQNSRLEDFAGRLNEAKTSTAADAKALREEVSQNLQTLGGTLVQTLDQISQAQKERLDRVSGVITELTQKSGQQQDGLRMAVEQRLDAIRTDGQQQDGLRMAVEQRLDAIRTENTEKLEGIRQTVDEKLQSTLNERLGASFQVVSEWLEKVHRSMGEMQNLANGVGDLKRLLTNVKSRGTWGEVALGNILEESDGPGSVRSERGDRPW